MDLQDLSDQERLYWDSWDEWMAGKSLWYLFWGKSSSSQQLREDKKVKQCGNVCGFFFHSFDSWILKHQTFILGCHSVLQRHSICKSDFILLTGRAPCSVLSLGWLLNPAWIREGSKKLVRETGLASVLLQVLGLCLYFLVQGFFACVPVVASVDRQLHCGGMGEKIWIFCVITYFHEECLWQECWAYFAMLDFSSLPNNTLFKLWQLLKGM